MADLMNTTAAQLVASMEQRKLDLELMSMEDARGPFTMVVARGELACQLQKLATDLGLRNQQLSLPFINQPSADGRATEAP